MRHTFNGYSDIDDTVFKRDFPSSTAPIWDTRSYRQIQEQILPMQQQIQQQIQPQAQPQFDPLVQHQIQQQIKNKLNNKFKNKFNHKFNNYYKISNNPNVAANPALTGLQTWSATQLRTGRPSFKTVCPGERSSCTTS